MAPPTQTSTYNPPYHTVVGTNIDAGNFDVVLTQGQVSFEKGFSVQTGTLTAMSVIIEDSLDGDVFVDNTQEYASVATLASNDVYKINLHAPVHSVRIRCTRTDAVNAVDVKVLAPNR